MDASAALHEPTRDMAEFPGSLDATFLKDLQVSPRPYMLIVLKTSGSF